MTTLDTAPWPSLELVEQIVEGNRNEVWRGSMDGCDVAVRQSRRAGPSLDWELDLIEHLAAAGFRVPTVIKSADGRRHVDGVVVQRWLDGRPPETPEDWQLVADTLRELHRTTVGYPQRPGCCAVAELTRTATSVDAEMGRLPDDVAQEVLTVFATVAELPVSVIHGDPMAGNLRIDDGVGPSRVGLLRVGLLDFDESRVDVAWNDLSNLGIQVLDDADHGRATELSDAWEAANGWVAEPAYARQRLDSLRRRRSTHGPLLTVLPRSVHGPGPH